MKRSRRGFMWMSIIIELSLIMGIALYGLIHTGSTDQANEGGLVQPAEVELFLSSLDEETITDEDDSSIGSGGPYTATPVLHVNV